jgi:diguanylate cyclase (GGDEF)-like protein
VATILVVEDDEHVRHLLETRLRAAGYEVLAFPSAVAALSALATNRADLVLMDVGLPEMDGVEACKRLAVTHPDLPVVFVTSRVEVQERVTGLEAGARDYIAKPFAASELLARVKVVLREASLLETARQYARALETLALVDPLTGVSNRRYLDLRFPEELARSMRYARPLSCLMLDVDDFKAINDTFGHAVGDRVLKDVARVLRAGVRVTDSLVRCGGEEFVVLMPETDIGGARTAAERLRAAVAALPSGAEGLALTVSIGVAEGATEDLLVRADQAMYGAKRGGKNRVEVAAR